MLDLPVFCRDGVAWSSRLVVASMSPMLREALSSAGPDEGAESCLVLPEVSRAEFCAFSKAVFADETDESLDFVAVVKVAEVVGAIMLELPQRSEAEEGNGGLPAVDYKVFRDNAEERRKVGQCVQYIISYHYSNSWSGVLLSISSRLNKCH